MTSSIVFRPAFRSLLRERAALRRTERALRRLSDAALEDIGMNRADIDTMVGR